MTTEELHRKHLAALITGDLGEAAKLNAFFNGHDRTNAVNLLRAACAVALEYRFGPGAGLGAGPVDYDELRVFMAELRRAGAGAELPPDYLAVEAAVRSLYGEPHLIEPLERRRRSQAFFTLLEHQTHRHQWLAANPWTVVDRAKQTMTIWIVGAPEGLSAAGPTA